MGQFLQGYPKCIIHLCNITMEDMKLLYINLLGIDHFCIFQIHIRHFCMDHFQEHILHFCNISEEDNALFCRNQHNFQSNKFTHLDIQHWRHNQFEFYSKNRPYNKYFEDKEHCYIIIRIFHFGIANFDCI